MSLSQLIEGLQRQEFALDSILDPTFGAYIDATPPEDVVHFFACDCARRAVLRASAAGVQPPTMLEAAIDEKCRWLRKEIPAFDPFQVPSSSVPQKTPKALIPPRPGSQTSTTDDALLTLQRWLVSDVSPSPRMLAYIVEVACRKAPFSASNAVQLSLALLPATQHAQEREWQRERFLWLLSLVVFGAHRWLVLAPGGSTPQPCPPDVALHAGI